MAKHPPEMIRHAYQQEIRNERSNCTRAVEDIADHLALVQKALHAGDPPRLEHLRYLAAQANEAYQRAAAWRALQRVESMLPDIDETKEGLIGAPERQGSDHGQRGDADAGDRRRASRGRPAGG